MSTVQELLNDIDLRYRNTFEVEQKVYWMNQVLREVYNLVRHNKTPPFNFKTVAGQAYYPLPDDCEAENIEEVTLQINNSTNPTFITLPYRQLNEEVGVLERFYSIVERNLFINPTPNERTSYRDVFIYYQKGPKKIDANKLDEEPDLGEEHEELLILGTLERIAAARKDSTMKSNFAADYELSLQRYRQSEKRSSPDFVRTKNVMPWRRATRRRTVADLLSR